MGDSRRWIAEMREGRLYFSMDRGEYFAAHNSSETVGEWIFLHYPEDRYNKDFLAAVRAAGLKVMFVHYDARMSIRNAPDPEAALAVYLLTGDV